MNFDIVTMLKTVPAALIGLTVHEFSHAYVANKLGDSTAKDQGRLTLNPVKHIDPIGFILIVVAGFGWAKPVQFNPENLKKRHLYEILISVAGPISNLLLGIALLILCRLLFIIDFFSSTEAGFGILQMLILWAVINFGLFVFNLIPIPPLDGSHFYTTFLKIKNPDLYAKVYKYGTWALLLIILAENRLGVTILPITPIINAITKTMISILHFN